MYERVAIRVAVASAVCVSSKLDCVSGPPSSSMPPIAFALIDTDVSRSLPDVVDCPNEVSQPSTFCPIPRPHGGAASAAMMIGSVNTSW